MSLKDIDWKTLPVFTRTHATVEELDQEIHAIEEWTSHMWAQGHVRLSAYFEKKLTRLRQERNEKITRRGQGTNTASAGQK